MNKQTQEALKMAIEALEMSDAIVTEYSSVQYKAIQPAINACKAALDTKQVRETQIYPNGDSPEWNLSKLKPAQEPVAWMNDDGLMGLYKHSDSAIPLYTHPHQWQGLSDAEILDKAAQIMVERHYKEKNT